MACSSRSLTTPELKYDVFISFRGEDTRTKIVGFLRAALVTEKIDFFKDDEFMRGEKISRALLKAIEESRIAVVIFSERYASSTWCLDELVKIMECRKAQGQIVIPVFYRVDPSHVRIQSGSYGKEFARHEERFKEKSDIVQRWRAALREAANLWGLISIDYRDESELVKKIVREILKIRSDMWPIDNTDLVGVESRIMQMGFVQASSSSTYQPKHDVFISFRGYDTRDGFASYLSEALSRKKVKTFIDRNLPIGADISSSILNAGEHSKISIIIFSKDYAHSAWCLDELVHILHCKKKYGQVVFPVFYHTNPSDIRKQTGSFGEAFRRYDENVGYKEKSQRWRTALTEAGNLSGCFIDGRRSEVELVEEIVKHVSKRLNEMSPSDIAGLVGVKSKNKKIESSLCNESKEEKSCVKGIWGIGGIGKTTLASAVFNKIWSNFEGSYFLKNVRMRSKEGGLIHLQRELLSAILGDDGPIDIGLKITRERLGRKKLLIVFDDVTSLKQIEELIGDLKWLGPGSQTIITSRDRQVLKNCGVNDDYIYEMEGLCDDDARQLFKSCAFDQNCPPEDEEFMELINKVVEYAKGVPLPLKVLGSLLFDKPKSFWKNQIIELENCPLNDVQQVLKISYDDLDGKEKSIFLDIACFFEGQKRSLVGDILIDLGFSSTIGIDKLIDKSLITISFNNIITMHDLLQELGKDIVQQQSIKNPGKRSRLWHHEDISYVLNNNLGTDEISGICLDMSKLKSDIFLDPRAFKKMHGLTFLKLYNSNYKETNKVHGFEDLESAFTKLRFLHWHGYPLESLPSKFQPKDLVRLEMPRSNIKLLWNGAQDFPNLKHINLSHSENLKKIPNLSKVRNLRTLILEGCTRLFEIPSSIQGLNELHILNLRGCSKLRTVPNISRNVERLNLDGTAIRKLPSIEYPSRLVGLYLSDCSRLQSLPSSISKLKRLLELNLSGCQKLESLPDNLGDLEALENLEANDTAIRGIPPSIVNLEKLHTLSLQRCKGKESVGLILPSLSGLTFTKNLDLSECQISKLPDNLGQLSSLASLCLRGNNFEKVPTSIKNLSKLYFLDLSFCERLQSLPELPMGVHVQAHNCTSLEAVSDLSFLFSPTSSRQNLNLANGFKLDQNALANKWKDALPKTQVEELYRALDTTICFPGDKIPRWFKFQSTGSSLTPSLPLGWMNESFLGFALCAVVDFPHHDHNGGKNINVHWECMISDEDGTMEEYVGHLFSCDKKDDVPNNMRSDHVFLGYNLGMHRKGEPDNPIFDPSISGQTIKFHAEHYCGTKECCCEVKKCGIHLLYIQDCDDSIEKSTEVLNEQKEEEPRETAPKVLSRMKRRCKRNNTLKFFTTFWKIRSRIGRKRRRHNVVAQISTPMKRRRKNNHTIRD